MKFRIVVFMTMLAVIATGLGWVSETAQAQATTKTHRLQILRYISPTANFTIGDTLTGDLSGATGIIRADNNSGSSGSLTLTDLVPGPTGDFFLDTELISDDTGADATVDGVLSSFTQCSFCHLLHGSPGGALNTADTFDNTCLTCHGSGSTEPNAPFPMQFHTNESCTNNCGERPFFLGCSTCHLPHANLENRLYDGGLGHENSLEHPHSQPNDCESGGGLVKCDGFNRKLVGTVYDGTRIAKIATPITVLTASWTGGVATMTLKVNNAPNAPPHTFMVGDRITVRDVWSTNNATGIFGLGFNGDFIVESVTNWDAVLEATITYKLATDPGTYQLNDLSSADPNTGMVQSTGWPVRPSVNNAGWTAGTATLALGGDHSIETGDAVSVTGVESAGNPTGDFNSGFNGVFTVTAVTGNDVSYLLAADPGAFQQSFSGRTEYPGSRKVIQIATQDTGAETLTLRIYNSHAIQVGNVVTAFKDDPNPTTFSAEDSVKRFLVTAIAAAGSDHDDIVLSCLTQIPGNELCNLGNPLAVDFTGGIIQSSGSLRPVVFESRGDSDFAEDSTHSFADVDEDGDNVMDGPCELCHTRSGINHPNYDFGDSHRVGKSCTASCHTHSRPAGAFFR